MDTGYVWRQTKTWEKNLTLARFPNAVTSDGTVVTKPDELVEAEMIINLCQWFHCTPEVAEKWMFGNPALACVQPRT